MPQFFRRNRNPNRNATSSDDGPPPPDSANFLQQARTLVPAEVRMISGCEDEQTSADVCGAGGLLPDPGGRAGGACTSALLEILHENVAVGGGGRPPHLTFQRLLMLLRDRLSRGGHSQIPQLTSSRPLDLDGTPFSLTASPRGARRALLVGINYRGQSGELRGCHNDVRRMMSYLVNVQGFPPEDVEVLMDDDAHRHRDPPVRARIIAALRRLVAVSRPGDSVFFHYSGHGGFLTPDFNSYKIGTNEYDQTLIPLDHGRSGQIRDFSLFNHFVRPMPAGVVVTCLMDCCHSGSVLDLPYSFMPTNTGRSSYAMEEKLGLMSNLAFLHVLAGGVLPPTGLFENVTQYLEGAVGGGLEEFQGMMGDSLAHEIEGVDYGALADEYPADAVDLGDGDAGDFDGEGVAGGVGDYGGVAGGGDAAREVGFDGADHGDARAAFGSGDDFGGGYAAEDGGCGDEGCGAADETVAEGCGDEGCGDLLSSLADCLTDMD